MDARASLVRIAEWRKRRGWTQAKLASQLGMSVEAVRQWEQNRSHPRPTALAALARCFEIEVSDLFRSPGSK